jgi:hypothetical protein
VLGQLKGAKGCVWAQGISQSKVNKEWVIASILMGRTDNVFLQRIHPNHIRRPARSCESHGEPL